MAKTKKVLAMLLVCALLLSLTPASVLAEESDFSENDETNNDANSENGIVVPVEETPPLTYHLDDMKADVPENNVLPPDKGSDSDKAYSSYSENRSTVPKNQNPYGSCWAFSATAVMESSLLSKKLVDTSIDLSETQLAYFFYHDKVDPLGNANGDSTKFNSESEDYLDIGGSNLYTMWSLVGWTNGAHQLKMGYTNNEKEVYDLNKRTYPNYYAYEYDIAHVQNAYVIPIAKSGSEANLAADDLTRVKNAIKQYGAVGVSVNWDSSAYSMKYKSFYNAGASGGGHAVTIVGWNDEFPKEYFNTAPTGNGAWLVKNSWGEGTSNSGADGDADYTDDIAPDSGSYYYKLKNGTIIYLTDSEIEDQVGYFWMSYYDPYLCSGNAYVYDCELASTYDNNYQYDGSCYNSTDKIQSGDAVCATYVISANEVEKLSAVGVGIYTANVEYSVQIYKRNTMNRTEVLGTGLLSKPVTGTTTYTGYYTIPLNQEITFEKGDIFTVVITLTKEKADKTQTDPETISVFGDYSLISNEMWINFIADCSNDHTYVLKSNNSTNQWSNFTYRVKAYTNNVDKEKYAASLEMKDNIDVRFNMYLLQNQTNINDYIVQAIFDDETKTITMEDTHTTSTYTEGTFNKYTAIVSSAYAYQMADDVTINVYKGQVDDANLIKQIHYSPKHYCENQLAKSETATELKAVCKAALDYGANAQKYFSEKTYGDNQKYPTYSIDQLANVNTNFANSLSVSVPSKTASLTGDSSDFSAISASLVLGSETAIKFYFTTAEACATLSDFKNKFSVTAKMGATALDSSRISYGTGDAANEYVVKISGIPSYQLSKDYTLTLTNNSKTMSLTYSPMVYAYNKSTSTDALMANLSKSLAAYSQAADAMWPVA